MSLLQQWLANNGSERRDEEAATAFFKQAINNNGFPDKGYQLKTGQNSRPAAEFLYH
jgi:transposase-like protein